MASNQEKSVTNEQLEKQVVQAYEMQGVKRQRVEEHLGNGPGGESALVLKKPKLNRVTGTTDADGTTTGKDGGTIFRSNVATRENLSRGATSSINSRPLEKRPEL